MDNTLRTLICVAALACAYQPAYAQEPTRSWSGTGHTALSHNTGSVDATALSIEHELAFRSGKVELDVRTSLGYSRHSFKATGRDGEETRQTTTLETYSAQLSLRRRLGESARLVGTAGWDRDPTSGLSDRVRLLVGGGWGSSGRRSASVEATGGYLIERDQDGDVLEFPALSAKAAISRGVGAAGQAGVELEAVESLEDGDDLLVTARSRLQAPLTEHLGLAITYHVTWDNRPSDAFFDPTGEGTLRSTPAKTRTSLSASISVTW